MAEDVGMQSLKIIEYHGIAWSHVSFFAHCGN